MSVRDLIRSGITDTELTDHFTNILQKRAKDGFEAEKLRKLSKPVSESMATVSG